MKWGPAVLGVVAIAGGVLFVTRDRWLGAAKPPDDCLPVNAIHLSLLRKLQDAGLASESERHLLAAMEEVRKTRESDERCAPFRAKLESVPWYCDDSPGTKDLILAAIGKLNQHRLITVEGNYVDLLASAEGLKPGPELGICLEFRKQGLTGKRLE
jgi:hypothetical protein